MVVVFDEMVTLVEFLRWVVPLGFEVEMDVTEAGAICGLPLFEFPVVAVVVDLDNNDVAGAVVVVAVVLLMILLNSAGASVVALHTNDDSVVDDIAEIHVG